MSGEQNLGIVDENPQKLSKSQYCYSVKGALELRRDVTTKLRQIETGPQRTNSNLQTGLRSIECSVPEK